MGGRGEKAPRLDLLTFPLCAGSGGNTSPESCHGAHHAGFLALEPAAGGHLRYRARPALFDDNPTARRAVRALEARGVNLDGLWHTALYEDADFDAIDAPIGEEVTR
jgi:hypothetical protein